MKTLRCIVPAMLTVLVLIGGVDSVLAQGDALRLSLRRISGLGLGGQIQGLFQLSISGPADMTSATFEMDRKEIGTVNQAPFGFQFHTDSYTPGQHRFTATAHTAGGQSLTSNPVDVEIVTFSTGWQSVVRLLWPIFVIILLAVGAAFAVPLLSMKTSRRYEPGAARQYGLAGGTICRRCGRPYALSLFSPNLLFGKLARCPYCGKWTIARRDSQERLQAAEQAEAHNQHTVREMTPEERLRQQIEDSRMSG